MVEPFQSREPDAQTEGLLSRVAGRRSRAATVRELESLLAEADSLRDVTREHVAEVGDRHGVDLLGQLRTARRNLYRRFLEHCLEDFMLSDLELEDLRHLKRVLHLTDADVSHIQNRVARDVYGCAVETVLEDNAVDEEERAFLKRLRADLDVSDFHASQLYEEGLRRAQQRALESTKLESAFLQPDGRPLELEGSSRVGLAEAIQAVVDQLEERAPGLAWADVTDVRVRVSDGRVVQWSVRLRAGSAETPEERG